MERNHGVQVGDIFVESFTDEMGTDRRFVEVVRLKGKTMVEYSYIRVECFVDESCEGVKWVCRVRPLPGQFYNRERVFPAKVYSTDNGSTWWIKTPGPSRHCRYMSSCREGGDYRLSGDSARYALDKMGPEKRVIL